MEKKIGSNIQTMVASSSHSVFAAGGEENDLKIWKIEDMEKPVFVAKNVNKYIFLYIFSLGRLLIVYSHLPLTPASLLMWYISI